MSAVAVEIAFAQYRAFLAAYGVKRHRIPPPLRIPRPGAGAAATPAIAPPRRHASSVAEVLAVLAVGHKR